MSYHVFFAFSTGLKASMPVPKGLLANCQAHVAMVEQVLGFKAKRYKDNPPHWENTRVAASVPAAAYCIVAEDHNRWLRWLYERLAEWSDPAWATTPLPTSRCLGLWGSQPPVIEEFKWGVRVREALSHRVDVPLNEDRTPQTEVLTPEDVQTFWHGLQEIDVPAERWTRHYYTKRMEHLYEVMRGQESEGVTFNAEEPLTPKQAAAVICLFSEYLDTHDCRLDVPKGYDHLASSYDGGYEWCYHCGAVDPDELCEHLEWCDECSAFVGPGAGLGEEGWCEHVKDRPLWEAAERIVEWLACEGWQEDLDEAAVVAALREDCAGGKAPPDNEALWSGWNPEHAVCWPKTDALIPAEVRKAGEGTRA